MGKEDIGSGVSIDRAESVFIKLSISIRIAIKINAKA